MWTLELWILHLLVGALSSACWHLERLSAFSSLSVFVLSGKSSTHDISLSLSAKWHGQHPSDLFHCLGFLLLSSHDLFLVSSTASPWDLPHLDFLLLCFSPSISHQDQQLCYGTVGLPNATTLL